MAARRERRMFFDGFGPNNLQHTPLRTFAAQAPRTATFEARVSGAGANFH